MHVQIIPQIARGGFQRTAGKAPLPVFKIKKLKKRKLDDNWCGIIRALCHTLE